MTYSLSRLTSVGTFAYACFAVAKPRHLADGVGAPEQQAPAYDLIARTYAARDLPVSALAICSRDSSVVTAAMVVRIVNDLADAAIMGTGAPAEARTKVLGATLGWASLNTVALLIDRRRATR